MNMTTEEHEEWEAKVKREWQAHCESTRIVPDEYNPNGVVVGDLLQPDGDCLGPRRYYTPSITQGDEEE
jgi:hypothetical protein